MEFDLNRQTCRKVQRWIEVATRLSIWVLAVVLPIQLLSGQSEKNQEFKLVVDVELVGILVTVTTPEGALISDLKENAFEVYEDGMRQEIAYFGKESDQPLRLSLLFDSSISIARELRTQQEAAISFLQKVIRPRDRVSVFQVNDEVEQLVRFSSRLDGIIQAIRSIKPRGGTSLYDAIFLSAEELAPVRGRKVIVVISDGTDTTSETRLNQALRMAVDSEAVVYALIVQPIKSEPGRNLGGEHAMVFIAEKTGGRFFKIDSEAEARRSFERISDELRTQYYLGYYPKSSPLSPGLRRIQVKVNNPSYLVRAREGYYSDRKKVP
ncbi:MAG: VWA domain-containing protein [Acidobacteriota bacterium]